MATWAEFEAQAPDLAARVLEAFGRHKHHVLATLRRDGSPRVSGTEVTIALGALWLGCMPDSMKGRDLARDPRFALHSAPLDVKLDAPDARVSGRALAVTDAEVLAAFWRVLGHDETPMEAVVFRCELADASLITVEADELVVDSWRAGQPPRQIRRK